MSSNTAPAATKPNIANYGSIYNAPAEEAESPARVLAPPEGSTNIVFASQELPNEVPKPAVRKRIQQQQQQQDSEMSNANNQKDIPLTMKTATPQDTNQINKLQDYTSPDSQNNKTAKEEKKISLPLPEPLKPQTRPYPKKVFFIIANEFCERFSFYGFRTILVLYLNTVLGFSDSNATVSFHLFVAVCYVSPIFGAILGDSIWGRYRTILNLSILYLFGEIILVASSVYWNLNWITVATTFVGLFFIGLGTGGIKPNVCALGGDQFLAHESGRRDLFFSVFYGSINLGALLSMFLLPMLRSNYKCVDRADCYPLAFGSGCALMALSIVVFLAASKSYVVAPLPERNVTLMFCQCTWLALKRKLAGKKLPSGNYIGQVNESLVQNSTSDIGAAVSCCETSEPKSREETANKIGGTLQLQQNAAPVAEREHWLYLAADQFDDNSIEEFRSVWAIILLFSPTPVFWCLFDQQGSLWTLQATRMDGRIPGTSFVLEPDQMSVMNPIFLLSTIPILQMIVYPSLARCNLLTSPIKRMTTGGMLAGLAFATSALIELHIQQSAPLERPQEGFANLLLVNGLNECSLSNSTISFNLQINDTQATQAAGAEHLSSLETMLSQIKSQPFEKNLIEPLSSSKIELLSNGTANQLQLQLNSYQIKFELVNNNSSQTKQVLGQNTLSNPFQFVSSCPFDSNAANELSVAPLAESSVKMLYLGQGNGKLNYKLFNESLELPPPGKARVRLLYEFFGSHMQAEKRTFALVRQSKSGKDPVENNLTQISSSYDILQTKSRDGQVYLGNHVDIDISSTKGDLFKLISSDSLLSQGNQQALTFLLEPGTRNLIIVHQIDALNANVRLEVLQDNKYRINILYQILPYILISVGEAMFSITTLEFAYSNAPDSMRSILLGVVSSTTALGNLLTVAVELVHPFSNVAHDFAFYALLMIVDMLIFALIGSRFKPRRAKRTA